ncbi:MAG: HAD-IIIC family phosphatase [Caulobacteraceae bacterium]
MTEQKPAPLRTQYASLIRRAARLLRTPERLPGHFRKKLSVAPPATDAAEHHAPLYAPLYAAEGPKQTGRLLLLGTCQAYPLLLAGNDEGYHVDHYLLGSNIHDDIGAASIDWNGYDTYIISPVLRHILHDVSGQENELLFWRLDEGGIKDLLENCIEHLRNKLDRLSEFATRPTIIVGFLEPSLTHAGPTFRFDPMLDFKEFVHDLNKGLKRAADAHPNFWFLDPNPILDRMGRARTQDDVMAASTHAALLGDWDYEKDQARIVAPTKPSDLFGADPRGAAYAHAILHQVRDILHAINSSEKIKLVILDLDDTLWRGIAAEDDIMTAVRREGWPLGLVEALLVFKRRGGLLAICSKNSHDETLVRFKQIWGNIVTIEDFASTAISWDPKPVGISKILSDTNILPDHTLFIDDNPREIEEVRAAFPSMKFSGPNHYLWRQRILSAPDMLVGRISSESANRTELVRAKIERDHQRETLSREDWLKSLDIQQTFSVVTSTSHTNFERAFELINKTNQFNTNGRRWTAAELGVLFKQKGFLLTSNLSDKSVDNGLTGVVIVQGTEIVQAVLSCRVFNLGAEAGMLHEAVRLILQKHDAAVGRITETGRNFVCHDIYDKLGFRREGDTFVTNQVPARPEWINARELLAAQ